MWENTFEQQMVCTPLSKFHWLLSLINKRFTVSNIENIGVNQASLTFDDGYRCAIYAAQEMDVFNNIGYFFLPISNIDGGPLWIDKIMLWFNHVPNGIYSINGRLYTLTTILSRQRGYSTYMEHILGIDKYDTKYFTTILDKVFSYESLNIKEEYFQVRYKGLSNVECDRLKALGHYIGGHSVNHDVLSKLSQDQLSLDFRICSDHIGNIYNTDIYAYPFGHKKEVSQMVISSCIKSKFRKALMNDNIITNNDYKIPRMNISKYQNRYELEAAMSGLITLIKQWIAIIK